MTMTVDNAIADIEGRYFRLGDETCLTILHLTGRDKEELYVPYALIDGIVRDRNGDVYVSTAPFGEYPLGNLPADSEDLRRILAAFRRQYVKEQHVCPIDDY